MMSATRTMRCCFRAMKPKLPCGLCIPAASEAITSNWTNMRQIEMKRNVGEKGNWVTRVSTTAEGIERSSYNSLKIGVNEGDWHSCPPDVTLV